MTHKPKALSGPLTPREAREGLVMRLDPQECYLIKIVRQLSPEQRRLIVRCKNRDESGRQFTAAISRAAEGLEVRQLTREARS